MTESLNMNTSRAWAVSAMLLASTAAYSGYVWFAGIVFGVSCIIELIVAAMDSDVKRR